MVDDQLVNPGEVPDYIWGRDFYDRGGRGSLTKAQWTGLYKRNNGVYATPRNSPYDETV